MKILLVSTLYTFFCLAGTKSINPDRTVRYLFELYDGYTRYTNGTVKVKGLGFNPISEEYSEKAQSYYMETSEFDYFHNLGLSTFEATPGDDYNSFGTAFHVGGNFLLTNQHVLSTKRDNTTQCKRFQIKLNYDQYKLRVQCKQVHYCDRERDFCLIEMHEYPRGQSLSDKKGYTINPDIAYDDTALTTIIGNSRGFGLHASQGSGRSYIDEDSFRFYAPVFGGNSGGPIFNEKDEVIGIVKQQSALLYGERAYNVGISIKEVLRVLEENLEDQSILDQLNIKKDEPVLDIIRSAQD